MRFELRLPLTKRTEDDRMEEDEGASFRAKAERANGKQK